MIVGIPVMQLLLFGYAINQDVRHLRAGVADQAGTQRARWLVADAQASAGDRRRARAPTARRSSRRCCARGEISVGLLIPADFEQRLVRRDRPAAQLLVDGSDPIVLQAPRARSRCRCRRRAAASPRAAPARAFELRAFYNPERRSAVQIVPGCAA